VSKQPKVRFTLRELAVFASATFLILSVFLGGLAYFFWTIGPQLPGPEERRENSPKVWDDKLTITNKITPRR
jgi:hypothetical protein